MLRKSDTNAAANRRLQIVIKRDIDTYTKPRLGLVLAQLQEARSQVFIALSRYRAVEVEDGTCSEHIFPAHLSGRQIKLLDIAGSIQIESKKLSILNLLHEEEEITPKSLTNILERLSDVLSMPGVPPLKAASRINIENAIILIFETMRKCGFFPAESLLSSIKIIVALSKSIDKEKLQHLLCQYPDLIKEIYNNPECKQALNPVDGRLKVVAFLHQKLFPPQSSLFGTIINYPVKLFQAASTQLTPATNPEDVNNDRKNDFGNVS